MTELIDPNFDIDEICTQLTLREKASLLSGYDFWHTAPVERLGIPSIRVSDGPNGVKGSRLFNGKTSACFPCGPALASTWDKRLLLKAGKYMADEAKAKNVHVILGPTCNIPRSPLSGRGFEMFGEDPTLSGIVSALIVNGIEGEGISATIKHYVGNDQEYLKKSVDTIITERALREIYLKPFQIVMRDSNPGLVMSSYNNVNGESVSDSKKFLIDILRTEWGWDGTVMSDWFGTYSVDKSIKNGLAIEMPGPQRFRDFELVSQMVISNSLHLRDVDARVKDVLKLVKRSFKSGVTYDRSKSETVNQDPEIKKILRKLQDDSIVLLKNERGFLPLSNTDSIGVIGPLAKHAAYCGGGSAAIKTSYIVTPYSGIVNKLDKDVPYSTGCQVHKNLPALGPHLINSKGKKGYEASFYLEPPESPNRTLIEYLELDESYISLIDYTNPKVKNFLFYIDFEGYLIPEETGTYEFGLIVLGSGLLLINDKVVVDNKTEQRLGEAFFGAGTIEEKGTIHLNKGQKYKFEIKFGTSPTRKLKKETFPSPGGLKFGYRLMKSDEELISEAVEVAKSVEKVVIFIGLTQEWETEGFDRPDMSYPRNINKMVEEVLKVNKNVVVVNQTGSPIEMPWLDKVPAVLQAWFGGSELGSGIADVLFGDVTPSGKLAVSFPIRVEDNPAFLNFGKPSGRRVLYGEDIFVGYRYYEKMKKEVAFPFGHGLSYTSFKFSNFSVSRKNDDTWKVALSVSNTGDRDGAEVIQVYVAPVSPSIIRPVKELVNFEKVFVGSGEKESVVIDISIKYAISYWDEYSSNWVGEAGEYMVLVGNSSDNILLEWILEVKETIHWLGV